MIYIFLSEQFFIDFPEHDYPEIERKQNRPYIMVKITINSIDFAIPLRSNISHNNTYWTNKDAKCGVDFSKAVVISNNAYVDSSKKPHIRDDEHKTLKGKEYAIKTNFEKYINQYKKALKKNYIERNKRLCQFSTLQYFHKEIGI